MAFKTAINLLFIILFLITPLLGAEPPKDSLRPEPEDFLIRIAVENKEVTLTMAGDDFVRTVALEGGNIKKTPDEILINGKLFLNRDGFVIGEQPYPLDSIDKIRMVIGNNSNSEIYFYKKTSATQKRYRSKKQNEISVLQNIVIAKDQFVRGSVISFWADINVDGEINEDVIAIYGNIQIGDNAVIRGNVISINGKIDVSKKASIYGSMQSSLKKNKFRFDKWKKWSRKDRSFSPIVKFHYNRIDGASPFLGVNFFDEDSVLPEIDVYAGYAFESERWHN